MDNIDTKNLENLLKCKICEEIFNNPAILDCGHTFCSPCLTKSQHCPECPKKEMRWKRNVKRRIKLSVKWHTGNDIVNSLKLDHKNKNKIMMALKENMQCAVCCGFVVKAVVTVCGHIFCRSCLEAWTTANHFDCPVCRTKFHMMDPLISWPLGDKLAEETRTTLKRSRPEDSGKKKTVTKKPKTRSSTAQKEREDVKTS